jgi:hypothetical protein
VPNNMPPMRAARPASAVGCLLVVALGGGCGGGSDSGSSTRATETAKSRPAPPKGTFPSPEGRTLGDLLKLADAPSELVVSPAATVFYKGQNRYPFGIAERKGGQIEDAEVALYFARVPSLSAGEKAKTGNKGAVAQAETAALDEPASGPFPAKLESLAAAPGFQAQTTSEEPEQAAAVYSAELSFPKKGEWRIAALIRRQGEVTARLLPSAFVGQFERVPRAGEPAPKIHTPVPSDVRGDRSKLTTRVPADTQNTVDYAEVLGRKPIVLLFATPRFCQSRVCGPVVDVTEQAKRRYGNEAAFIHMEIYNDNDPGKGVRPQVRAFHLPTEPWLFTIDRNGRIAARLEGSFGVNEFQRAIQAALS